ncbi:uncharacterized protein [Apostichopus japonicus]|uniref:uncharacterized protein isoform X2 n=1 Tax=Stichopus japonicus TaxID=307972 RepID=UPI003AB54B5D
MGSGISRIVCDIFLPDSFPVQCTEDSNIQDAHHDTSRLDLQIHPLRAQPVPPELAPFQAQGDDENSIQNGRHDRILLVLDNHSQRTEPAREDEEYVNPVPNVHSETENGRLLTHPSDNQH